MYSPPVLREPPVLSGESFVLFLSTSVQRISLKDSSKIYRPNPTYIIFVLSVRSHSPVVHLPYPNSPTRVRDSGHTGREDDPRHLVLKHAVLCRKSFETPLSVTNPEVILEVRTHNHPQTDPRSSWGLLFETSPTPSSGPKPQP